MGFFKKLINKIKGKTDVAQQIKQKNLEQSVVVASQKKYDEGLRKSSNTFANTINEIAKNFVKVNDEFENQLLEGFIQLDIGISSSQKIVDAIIEEVKFQRVVDQQLIKEIIIDKLFVHYIQDSIVNTDLVYQQDKTNVYLIVGVNGVGKATTIAKLAKKFLDQNKKVLLIAGDTFRAGAVAQLQEWATRLNCPIILPDPKQDAAAVIFKGLKVAFDESYDLVLCDTSGRLQNKTNLMNELAKIYQVINKYDADNPKETLLVLDASTGQSSLVQAKAFNEVAKLTGIILTKMDSSSKGGIILSISDNFKVPVKLIGLGEQLDDLQTFDLEKYIVALVQNIDFEHGE